jgi:hemerythrin
MAEIIWNDSYSVNNAVIDAQHKEWIAIYNKLDRILLQGSNDEVSTAAADALQAMQDYANYHFRQEEQYLQEINYPDLVAHKRLHTDFDDQLYGYNKNLRNGKLVLNSEVIAILKKWLQHHILHEDQKYCAFLTRN